jgi:uncharacterized protein (DUF2141 family)
LSQTSPVPLINQPLVPDAVAPGGPGFTLTVNGTGFLSGSVVNWNSGPRTTSFVNNKQLTATILASDISTLGTASIDVVNPDTGAASNIVFFPITIPTASVSFATSDDSLNAGSQGVVAADFNGDGKLDLAINAFVNGEQEIFILLGNGDGTFGAPAEYGPVGESYPVLGDFNGDGKLDLAVAGNPNNNVSVLLGNGDGTFAAPLSSATTYEANGLVSAGDFNADGNLDLAVTTSGGVSVLLGKGNGTFQPPELYSPGH